jgi:pimeloyl-ACP methyl ester carboxylesterase
MSVEHARALAARGVASLRLDIAGLGDAAPLAGSPRAALYRKESVADVREALDLLERCRLSNFTLVGHCSGAWLALNAGRADPRVRGLFLVNLQRFIWTGEEDLEALMAQAYRATDSYLQEIGSGAIWQRLLEGKINWRRLPGIARAILRRAGRADREPVMAHRGAASRDRDANRADQRAAAATFGARHRHSTGLQRHRSWPRGTRASLRSVGMPAAAPGRSDRHDRECRPRHHVGRGTPRLFRVAVEACALRNRRGVCAGGV